MDNEAIIEATKSDPLKVLEKLIEAEARITQLQARLGEAEELSRRIVSIDIYATGEQLFPLRDIKQQAEKFLSTPTSRDWVVVRRSDLELILEPDSGHEDTAFARGRLKAALVKESK